MDASIGGDVPGTSPPGALATAREGVINWAVPELDGADQNGFRTERSDRRAKPLYAMTYIDSSVAVCIFMHNSRLDRMRRVQPCLDAWTDGTV